MQQSRPYLISANVPSEKCNFFRQLAISWNDDLARGVAGPLPNYAQLNDFYSQEYRYVMGKKTGIDNYLLSPFRVAQTKSQIEWIRRATSVSPESWVDVGAGYGLLIRMAAENLPGCQFMAVEASKDAQSELAHMATVIDDTDFWSGIDELESFFDVVSLSHVLEHMLDPEAVVERMRYYLKCGGLVLIEVPNDDRDILFAPSRTSDLPHLHFFGLKGLTQLVERSGFEILRSDTVGDYPRKKQYPFMNRVKRRLIRWIKGPMSLLDDKLWYCESGPRRNIRVLARANQST